MALHSVAMPELFVPVHGEYEHLVGHAALAKKLGMSDRSVLLATDGDRLALTDDGISKVGEVSGEYIYMDGTAGQLTQEVLDQRILLGKGGVVMVFASVDLQTRTLSAGPFVESRGWASDIDRGELEQAAAQEATTAMQAILEDSGDLRDVVRAARRSVGRYVNAATNRRPVIMPVIRTN